MHDCRKPNWKYELAIHSVCCTYLLRELTEIEEFRPDLECVLRFKALLMDMKKGKERTMDRGADEISRYHMLKYDVEYDRILEKAEAACSDTFDSAVGKEEKGERSARSSST